MANIVGHLARKSSSVHSATPFFAKHFANLLLQQARWQTKAPPQHPTGVSKLFYKSHEFSHKIGDDERPEIQTKKLRKCTVISGDGIGPEMMEAVYRVFEALNVPFEFEEFMFSELHFTMSAPMDIIMSSITRNGVCLMGRLITPRQKYRSEIGSLNANLRRSLDLFANVVTVETIPGLKKVRHKDLDFFIIRENTEGQINNVQHSAIPGVVDSITVVTREKSTRIAKFACDFATKLGRKKVTAIHRAKFMQIGDGIFLKCCQEVAKLYPNLEFEEMYVDNAAVQMTRNPGRFDVMVMPNQYGVVLAEVGAGLIGGAGICPGANYSDEVALFEPGAKHSFVKAATKDIANPTAMLLASAQMLAHSNLLYYAKCIRAAIRETIKEGKVLTADMGGTAKSSEYVTAVINNMQKRAARA